MDSGLRRDIIGALRDQVECVTNDNHQQKLLSLIDAVLAIPADVVPGGELPDPWPGMAFSVASGLRAAVQTCERHNGEYYVNHTGGGYMKWSADGIDEVRAQDGRILYRRAN